VTGGAGADIITGNAGADSIVAGGGADRIYAETTAINRHLLSLWVLVLWCQVKQVQL